MTHQEVVSLREYIEALIIERDKALALQHNETQRRLDALNGEADRLRQIQATYLPREVFEDFFRTQADQATALANRLDETRAQLEKTTKETTDRLDQRIDELRETDQARGGREGGVSSTLKSEGDREARNIAIGAVAFAFLSFLVAAAAAIHPG